MIPDDPRARIAPARPALAAWLCVAGGLLLGRAIPATTPVWAGAALALSATAGWAGWRSGPTPDRRRAFALACLALAGVAGSAGWMRARVIEPADRLPHIVSPTDTRAVVAVEGILLDHPEHGPPTFGDFATFIDRDPVTRLRLRLTRLRDTHGWRPITGVVSLRIDETTLNLHAGDRALAEGLFLPIPAPVNPGQPDPRLLAAQRGDIGRILIPGRANVRTLTPPSAPLPRLHARFLRLRADARAAARGWLHDSIARLDHHDTPAPALLAALLLGDRDDDSLREIDDPMRRTGAAHLLSISGLHLGILVWLAVTAGRAVGVRGGAESLLVAALIVVYLFVVPARTPIVRASVAALAWLLTDAAGRRTHPLALLAWIWTGVLLWRPLDLWSPGYQLSFSVVAGLVTLTPGVWTRWRPMASGLEARTASQTAAMLFCRLGVVAFVAWLISTPMLVYHFGLLSPLGAVASVALYPLVAAALGVGVVTIVMSAALPSVGAALGDVLSALGQLIVGMTRALDALPFAGFHTPPVSVWWTIAAESVVVWLLVTRGAWRSGRGLALVGLVVVWFLSFGFTPALPGGVAARLDTLAVGDGSAHLIRSAGAAVLWDSGSSEMWRADRAVSSAVRGLWSWPVRVVVVTHPNMDHYSAVAGLVGPLGVGEVVVGRGTVASARSDPSGPVSALLSAVEAGGARVRVVGAGDRVRVGRLWLEFLHPGDGFAGRGVNDGSLVARLVAPTDAGDRVVLLTGDIEDAGIEALRAAHPRLAADVLQLPHHGSARPGAIRFVRDLDPALVVQSTGPSRVDDDRWADVRAGRAWLVTARDGAITVTIRQDGTIAYQTMRGAAGVVNAGSGTATNTPR